MREPETPFLLILVGHVCQDADPALLMRVLVGQTPRDSSLDDGQIIALDRKTACDLAASGQAVPVHRELWPPNRGVCERYGDPLSHTAPAPPSCVGEIWRKTD